MTVEELHALLSPQFPVKRPDERAALELVNVLPHEDGVRVVLRLVTWDTLEEGGPLQIRDIKEQEVWFGELALYADRQRASAFLTAWRDVVVEVLATETIETMMPDDFVNTSPLKLERANTAPQFYKALRMKSRLGRFIG